MTDTSDTARPLTPRQRRRALVLVNPHARRGAESLAPVLEVLSEGGLDVAVETFSSPAEVSPDILARKDGMDLVVLCGGDGTMNAAARGVMQAGLPMGVIPMGTANDLARTLGISFDLVEAAKVIVAGRTRRIDIGDVNGHPFFNVASIGLSADLARGLSKDVKKRFGRLGYALTAIKVLLRARRFHADIITKDGSVPVDTLQIGVGNGRYYGGGMAVAAEAAIDDHHLDLYSLEMKSVVKLALMARAFQAGRHGLWSEVRTARCTAFELRTKRPMPVNTDGELVTVTPALFRVLPAAIEVFAP